MSNQKRPDRLEALKRWQTSELDEARSRMSQLNAVVSDKQAALARIESDIESFHALVREQASGGAPLQPETLLRMSTFSSFQRQQLQSARDSHQQAARQADDAQRTVLQLFEHLSVVERLLERRQELTDKQELRSLQKQLDEGALSRAPRAQNSPPCEEDSTHGR